jgi:phosphopantetheinyl transferase
VTGDVVHLVVCSLTDVPGADESRAIADRFLDRAERDRIARLEDPELRHRRTVAAALVRLAVADLLDVRASDVLIGRSTRGAPIVSSPAGTDLRISASHAFPWIALAACSTLPVGVDVEDARRAARTDLRRIGALSPTELRHLAAMSDEKAADAQGVMWATKEAVLKATGLGLGIPLPSVTVTVAVGADRPPIAAGAEVDHRSRHAGPYDTCTHWLPNRFVLALATPAWRLPASVKPRDLSAQLRAVSNGTTLRPWLQQQELPVAVMSRTATTDSDRRRGES